VDVQELKKRSISLIRKSMKNGDEASASCIAGLFEVGANASFEDLAFYGKLLLAAQQYPRAVEILASAYKKNQSNDIARDFESAYWLNRSRDGIREMRAGAALSFMLEQSEVGSVLDVGAGGGEHALEFSRAGKRVDCVDLGRSIYYDNSKIFRSGDVEAIRFVMGDFFDFTADHTYDLVWCSHVLEHQSDANAFLKRCLGLVTEGKWLAITVPPLKHSVVGGHVSLWNAGLLLYQLVIGGNDCSDAIVMNYNYNISVLVRRRPISLPELDYDAGDIDRLSSYFPRGCQEGFDGRMICASVSFP
jgi:SAM-dependent methyltransferase